MAAARLRSSPTAGHRREISLHKTLPRAKKVMNDLWEAGCGWWIPGHVHSCHFGEPHAIVDLRKPPKSEGKR